MLISFLVIRNKLFVRIGLIQTLDIANSYILLIILYFLPIAHLPLYLLSLPFMIDFVRPNFIMFPNTLIGSRFEAFPQSNYQHDVSVRFLFVWSHPGLAGELLP